MFVPDPLKRGHLGESYGHKLYTKGIHWGKE